MHSGGIIWSDLNPFNYEACIGDYCTDLDIIGETITDSAVTVGNAAISAGEVVSDSAKTVYDFYAESPEMLPAIVFGWPLMLLGAGCATPKRSEPSVSLDFNESDDPEAYRLYSALTSSGVKQSDIDKGYSVINFDRKYCASQEERTCIVSAGDMRIHPQEVFEYALNDYERFRPSIETTLGRTLPWVLDDMDPATAFDEEVRGKVTNAIDALKTILVNQGLFQDSYEYKERLAIGLFWLAAVVDVQHFAGNTGYIEHVESDLNAVGLGEFIAFLVRNGGFRVEGDYSNEYTALEAMKSGVGKCTENSKILFSVFRMAGLDPKFVTVKLDVDDVDNMRGGEFIRNTIRSSIVEWNKRFSDYNHLCVGIQLGERFRLFDPTFVQSDAPHSDFIPLTNRQYLSTDYLSYINRRGSLIQFSNNVAENRDKVLELTRVASELDPQSPWTNFERGNILWRNDMIDDAILEFTRTIESYPSYADAYLNRGILWSRKSETTKTIADLVQYLTLVTQDHENRYNRILRGLRDELSYKWKNNEQAAVFSSDTPYDIAKVEAVFLTADVAWLAGDKDVARDYLHIISDSFTLHNTPSDFTKQFFEGMFLLMPTDMRADTEIAAMLTSIRQAFTGHR